MAFIYFSIAIVGYAFAIWYIVWVAWGKHE